MDWSGQWHEYIAYERELQRDDPRHWFRMAVFQNRYRTRRWFLDLLDDLGDAIMARGKGTVRSGTKQQQQQWTTFVNIPVPSEALDEIREMWREADTTYDGLESLVREGYRVSFSFNGATDAVICAVTCKSDGDPNNGKTFTSFAGDWYTALQVALYKHYVVAGQIWGDGEAGSSRPAIG